MTTSVRASGHSDVIAIDGLGGAGKSTVARATACALSWKYLDTGASYRALTWALLSRGGHPSDGESAAMLASRLPELLWMPPEPTAHQVSWAGQDIAAEIRGPLVSGAVSAVAAHAEVRDRLVSWQRTQIARLRPIVVEGRDIGSVVAPGASVKIWLTAQPSVRAARRAAADHMTADHAEEVLVRRDAVDSSRTAAPAVAAPDAQVIDTSQLPVDEIVRIIVDLYSRSKK